MLALRTTDRFEEDVRRLDREGKNLDRLWDIVRLLRQEEDFDRAAYDDHQLEGIYADCRDLHIDGDWILIYKVEDNALKLQRTGRHSWIFRDWSG
jgi:mRNA interferase YafQ